MADESVAAELVSMKDYADTDHFEEAESALRGSIALSCVISEATTCDNVAGWSNFLIDDLHGAHRILLQHARMELAALKNEHWHAMARLGAYGDEAKIRAEAEAQA